MPDALPPEPPGEAIVVTGRALAEAAGDRAHATARIDRAELLNAPARGLESILVQVPGVQLFRRSDARSGHPTSQGVTLRALGGTASSRALLVLDGVPQADPFGGWVNWPAYSAGGLDEAVIIRGGGSVSYGPGALAGVIDLASLSRGQTLGSLEAGSREALQAHLFHGQGIGPGALTIDAQAGRSHGFIPVAADDRGPVDRPAGYRQASLRSRLVVPIGGFVEAQLGGLLFSDERERGVPFTANHTRGADLSLRLIGRGRWQWSMLGYGQWRNLRSSFASVDEARTGASRASLQDAVPSTGIGGRFELRTPPGRPDLRFGADGRTVEGESRELYAFAGDNPTRRRVSGGRSMTVGVFAEGSVDIGRARLNGGARIDHWRIEDGRLVELSLATGATIRDDQSGARSGWRPTARASAVVPVGAGAEMFVAAYTGWRLPTLNELFRPFRVGPDATAANPALKPEKLTGADLGLRSRSGPWQLEAVAFANRLTDAIANVTLGSGPGTFPGVGFVAGDYSQRRNIDAIEVIGVEGSAEYRSGPWQASAGASWSNARVRSGGATDGLRPAQVPALVLSGRVGWASGKRAAALQLRHSSRQYEDDENLRALPAATTLDAFAMWPVGRGVQLIARAENLLDELVVAGISSGGIVERGTPRTLWIGLRWEAD